jgi:undecaprenyl diphosphate synthase
MNVDRSDPAESRTRSDVGAATGPVRTLGAPRGLHVAIIMDGSGRWAEARGCPRLEGHRAGAAVVRRIVGAAPSFGVGTLTLFAFSADNWKRPPSEVAALLALLRDFLADFRSAAARDGIRIEVIGRRDRLSADLLAAIEAAESATWAGRRLHLRIAIDYSGRDAILRAARSLAGAGEPDTEAFLRALATSHHSSPGAPDVDLLIRTGGEQRLSDFLLWELAYAELYFTKRMWPEFGVADLEAAIRDFRTRERRFGRLPATPRSDAWTGGLAPAHGEPADRTA